MSKGWGWCEEHHLESVKNMVWQTPYQRGEEIWCEGHFTMQAGGWYGENYAEILELEDVVQ